MIRGKVLRPLSVKAGNANATAELDFNPHLIRPLPQPPQICSIYQLLFAVAVPQRCTRCHVKPGATGQVEASRKKDSGEEPHKRAPRAHMS
jgi:hypothetical protein